MNQKIHYQGKILTVEKMIITQVIQYLMFSSETILASNNIQTDDGLLLYYMICKYVCYKNKIEAKNCKKQKKGMRGLGVGK